MCARQDADKVGEKAARAANCPENSKDTLTCLRKASAEGLITTPTGAKGLGVTAWLPVYGTKVIPKNGRAFVTGDFNRVPVVIGSNRDEGRLFANGAILQGSLKTQEQFENNLRVEFGEKWQNVKNEYPLKDFNSIPLAYAAVFTDSLFACSAKTVSKAISKFTKVYAYEFSDQDAPISFSAPKELGSFGAYHSAEIQYVLQTKSLFFAPEKMTPDQKKLADIMQVAWASVARDGVPSFPSGAKWPELNPVKANLRRFATSGPETADDFEKFHKCEFWSAL